MRISRLHNHLSLSGNIFTSVITLTHAGAILPLSFLFSFRIRYNFHSAVPHCTSARFCICIFAAFHALRSVDRNNLANVKPSNRRQVRKRNGSKYRQNYLRPTCALYTGFRYMQTYFLFHFGREKFRVIRSCYMCMKHSLICYFDWTIYSKFSINCNCTYNGNKNCFACKKTADRIHLL